MLLPSYAVYLQTGAEIMAPNHLPANTGLHQFEGGIVELPLVPGIST